MPLRSPCCCRHWRGCSTDWVTQLAAADGDRRERTLRTAASQFTAALDTELSRLGGSLQLDGAMVERQDWDAYALRYATATANQSPSLVRGVWYVETSGGRDRDDDEARRNDGRRDGATGAGTTTRATTTDARTRTSATVSAAQLVLRQWMPEQRAFEEVAWPAELATVRGQLQKHADDPGRRGDGPRELMATTASLGDERTIVMPIVRVSMPRRNGRSRERFLGDVRLRGYTVVGLNLDDLVATRLPALVEEHFPDSADYRIAIVSRDGDRVVFESEPGAAAATTDAPDLTATFFQPRVGPMMVFARAAANGRGVETRVEAMPPPPRRHRALPSAPPRRSSTCSSCAIATATAPCARGRCSIRTATGRCASSTAPDRSRPPWRRRAAGTWP